MRFFTSDTHFGHARINDLAGRPFSSVEEMNEAIIERWNAAVSPEDEVWHLGDVALGPIAESLPLMSRLNGTKFLVVGNHDRIFSENKPSQQERFGPIYRQYFSVTFPGPIRLLLHNGLFVNVCHFPYSGDSHTDDRYPQHRPVDDGGWLIHGHVHEMWKINGRQINVGVDVWDFTPVSEDTILDIIRDGS